ncbi:hypothetical protein EXIGLDRAFT_696160 [Exidia glandulosa HHB12029]|uniref:Uncharacterized protein n=1 Tax=Exidia glandulosa HHB12029 TaxID=1314781 RepID=A0A165FJ75_EXIGL|nr:hypothetical protein EXIGLDRAFT_696160 [Exidia glandulosa HHB12029]
MQRDDALQDPQLNDEEHERDAAGERDIEARLATIGIVDESSRRAAQEWRELAPIVVVGSRQFSRPVAWCSWSEDDASRLATGRVDVGFAMAARRRWAVHGVRVSDTGPAVESLGRLNALLPPRAFEVDVE